MRSAAQGGLNATGNERKLERQRSEPNGATLNDQSDKEVEDIDEVDDADLVAWVRGVCAERGADWFADEAQISRAGVENTLMTGEMDGRIARGAAAFYALAKKNGCPMPKIDLAASEGAAAADAAGAEDGESGGTDEAAPEDGVDADESAAQPAASASDDVPMPAPPASDSAAQPAPAAAEADAVQPAAATDEGGDFPAGVPGVAFPDARRDDSALLARALPELRDWRAALAAAAGDEATGLAGDMATALSIARASDLDLTEIRLLELGITPSAGGLAGTPLSADELREEINRRKWRMLDMERDRRAAETRERRDRRRRMRERRRR